MSTTKICFGPKQSNYGKGSFKSGPLHMLNGINNNIMHV